MKNIRRTLERFGYSEYEARLYLAALTMGEGTVSDLARHSEIPRTTVIEVVKSMKVKGLLIDFPKKKRKYWVAQDPNKILKGMKDNETAFESLLPELCAIREHQHHKPSAQYFFGLTEIKKIIDDVIHSKRHISLLISLEDSAKFFGEEHQSEFTKRRLSNFLKIRVITNKTSRSLRLKADEGQKFRQMRFLPSEIDLKHIANFVYGDKVAMISFNRKEPMGLIIEDRDIAYANLLYFDNLWRHSSES